jgi:hypothetical protein
MVDMNMADKQVCGLILGNITVRFCNTIASVKDNVILFCLDEDRACITGNRIVPAVCPEEGHLHNTGLLYQGKKGHVHSSKDGLGDPRGIREESGVEPWYLEKYGENDNQKNSPI